jgi:membrane associated rhomboid family serine protease
MEGRQHLVEIIFRSNARQRCSEHALVLATVDIEFAIRRDAGDYILLVAESDAARARAELQAYADENSSPPRRVVVFPQQAGVWASVYGFVAVLLLVDIFDDRSQFGMDWHHDGRTQAGLILQGQWWRTVTALTLHADSAHLVGNLVVGSLFVLFAAQLLGSGLAMLSILLAGAVGNGLNAWIQRDQHTSVGASTAVFAALGIVVAYVWIRRRTMQASALTKWAPIVGGGVLLGYFGAGGPRTDVVAHATGFCSGLLLGALYGKLGDRLLFSMRVQFALGMAAVALLMVAWVLALGTEGVSR